MTMLTMPTLASVTMSIEGIDTSFVVPQEFHSSVVVQYCNAFCKAPTILPSEYMPTYCENNWPFFKKPWACMASLQL